MELLSIGELARRTGLTVKTVRFYADHGIVPPAGRSPAGHRHYDPGAVARLELVRTLRELGLDLATIRRVVTREATLGEVSAARIEAMDVQIRTLRLRRAVLSAAARSGSDPQEVQRMHELAGLSARERRALIDDFLGPVFAGLDFAVPLSAAPPASAGRHRRSEVSGASRPCSPFMDAAEGDASSPPAPPRAGGD